MITDILLAEHEIELLSLFKKEVRYTPEEINLKINETLKLKLNQNTSTRLFTGLFPKFKRKVVVIDGEFTRHYWF